jgi:hypothetical protein
MSRDKVASVGLAQPRRSTLTLDAMAPWLTSLFSGPSTDACANSPFYRYWGASPSSFRLLSALMRNCTRSFGILPQRSRWFAF